MPLVYRKPGVYLEESLLVNPGQTANATSVALFAGVAPKGPIGSVDAETNVYAGEPVLVESWSAYVATFGNFDTIKDPVTLKDVLSYLPYAVYSYFQNGGRSAYVVRAIDSANPGTAASVSISGYALDDPAMEDASDTAFTLSARYPGLWGNNLAYSLTQQELLISDGTVTDQIFTLKIYVKDQSGNYELVETFPNLSLVASQGGTYLAVDRVNDTVSGSRYVRLAMDNLLWVPSQNSPTDLTSGAEPRIPTDLTDGVGPAIEKVEGPVIVNIAGYLADATKENTSDWADNFVGATLPNPEAWTDRGDVFIVCDNCPPRYGNVSSGTYASGVMTTNYNLAVNTGNSYTASYGPWILISDPQKIGQVKAIPPGGAVLGVYARTDATAGVFRAPAGVIAGISNAVGVQTKFTDSVLGELNSNNINVIRSVVGSGISIMGARTRKSYGADRYVSARRTLIYLKEVLRRSTQYAVFENNDERLWTSMRMTADRILRNLWQAGGLRGANTTEAYYINCDANVNTPSVIASGEARMEIGVALEYPAEFIVIRLSQFDRSTVTNEITV